MTTRRCVRLALLTSALTAGLAGAQTIPVRTLPPATVRSAERIGSVYPGVRSLSGGRVLVNDQVGRRMLLLDSALRVEAVPFDSASGTAQSYGARALGMIASRGDTTLVAEPASLSFLVLDGGGKVVRVESAARPSDFGLLAAANYGFPRFDPAGRLIYRAIQRPRPQVPGPDGRVPPPVRIDSAPIVRMDFETRTVDTIARIRISSSRTVLDTLEGGRVRGRTLFEVLPSIDEWTVLEDGTLAIVRGVDYHIDWYFPDGTQASTPKMAMDWRRLTDDDKKTKVDSARAQYESTRTPESRARAEATNAPLIDFVDPSELPDYVPPVRTAGVKADPNGNLWILPSTTSFAGTRGLMYDVVNRKGEVIERVRFPEGRVLGGFGDGGIVYMLAYDGGSYFLEATRLR